MNNLLEPILNIEIRVPDNFMGDVMGDMSSRRGKIIGMDAEGESQLIKAQAPQSEIVTWLLGAPAETCDTKQLTSDLKNHPRFVNLEINARIVDLRIKGEAKTGPKVVVIETSSDSESIDKVRSQCISV